MRLQKQTSRIVGKIEYSKWVITVPPQQIGELGWNEGEELESKVSSNSLIVRRANNPKPKVEKMTYEDFRGKIVQLLKLKPSGVSWTDIRERLKLPQKVPNNLWVRTMEQEVGLIREFDYHTGKMMWRLKD